jgi:glycosyltransferase involved in cell wall biosynthesis
MAQPKRILYVINSLGAGGTERQLFYLLRGLDRERYTPYVLTIYDERHAPYHYKDALAALNIPIMTLAHGTGIRGRIGAMLRYLKIVWRLRPQVVQGCLHYANLIVRAVRPFCPPHRLFTSERSPYAFGKEMRSERWTYWLDDKLIVNSPHIREHVLASTPRPASKIQVIPNGIPVQQFSENRLPGLRDQLFPSASFVIGLVSRISPEKEHATLLNALYLAKAHFPDGLKVFFVGEVSHAETQRQIERLVAEYGLEDVICQFPVTDDVAPYDHAADVLILPSLFEGFPNVVLEAFAAGKPVIASVDADGVGVIEPGVTGWHFPTGDAAALAECLRAAWETSASQRAQMGEEAREVAARYSVETMVSQYMDLYS